MFKELTLIEEYLIKNKEPQNLDIVIEEALKIENNTKYFIFFKKKLIKKILSNNKTSKFHSLKKYYNLNVYDKFSLLDLNKGVYIFLNNEKYQKHPLESQINIFVSLMDIFKKGNNKTIKNVTVNKMFLKYLSIISPVLCSFIFYFLFIGLSSFVSNELSSREETIFVINMTIISTIILCCWNYINPYFKLKIPIYLIFVIYGLLFCFSSTIKKILGLELFFKLDFDPFIWMLSIVLYICIFYATLWVRIMSNIIVLSFGALICIIILLVYMVIAILNKMFKNFIDKEKFSIFTVQTKNFIIYLIYEFNNIVSIFTYVINKKIEYIYFNLFNFRDNISIEKRTPSKNIAILLIILLSVELYWDFEAYHDKTINSYYALYSSKNNGYCKNIDYDIYIIKDSGKAWLDQDEMTKDQMESFSNQLADFPEKRFVGIKCE